MDAREPLRIPVFAMLGTEPFEHPHESAIDEPEMRRDRRLSIERIEHEIAVINEHAAYHRAALYDLTAEVARIEVEYRRQLADVEARRAQLQENIPNLLRVRALLHGRRARMMKIDMDPSIRRRRADDPPPPPPTEEPGQ